MPRTPTLVSLWRPPPREDKARGEDDDAIPPDDSAVRESIEAAGLRKVVAAASDRDAHLFHGHSEEMRVVEKIARGELQPQAINSLTRMYRRKGQWHDPSSVPGWEGLKDVNLVRFFRASLVNASDDDEEEPAAAGDCCVFELLGMASKHALMSIVVDQQVLDRDYAKKLPRYKLLEALRRSVDRIRGLRKLLERRFAHYLALTESVTQALNIAMRAFFLNRAPDLGIFAATQLDRVRFAPVKVMRSRPVFRSRSDILQYSAARDLGKTFDLATENGEFDGIYACTLWAREALREEPSQSDWNAPPDQGKPDHSDEKATEPAAVGSDVQVSSISAALTSALFLSRFSVKWTAARMLTKAIPHLERVGRWQEVEEILCELRESQCCPGLWPWWSDRLAYVYERRLKNPGKALQVLEDAFQDKRTRGGARVAMIRRILRLSKPPLRWKNKFKMSDLQDMVKVPVTRTLNAIPISLGSAPTRVSYYDPNNQLCHVERLAEQHYLSTEGWARVDHAENTILRTLFGLCLWEVIFCPLPDVFQSEFQSGPLDIETDMFYSARKAQVDARLAELEIGLGADIVQKVWDEHYGQQCVGVNWDRYSVEDLKDVAKCLGPSGLATICRMFCEEFGAWSSGGIPDLFFWSPPDGEATAASGAQQADRSPSCKFVEVKSQNDKLSDTQIAWLHALSKAGLAVEVVKVLNSE